MRKDLDLIQRPLLLYLDLFRSIYSGFRLNMHKGLKFSFLNFFWSNLQFNKIQFKILRTWYKFNILIIYVRSIPIIFSNFNVINSFICC